MKHGFGSIAFAFAFLALCCVGGPLAAQANEKVTIRTDFTPAGTHAALHLAVKKGWFEEEGLDVDLQDGSGTINTIQLVGAGKVDVGQLSTSAVPVAREGGLDVKAIAGFARRNDMAVLVPEDSAIKSAQDLRGKRIVLFASSPWVPLIDTFLANAGLSKDDVKILFVDVNSMYSTYASGQADAVMSLAPFAQPVLAKIEPSRSIDAADYGINLPALGLVASDETIANRPEMLRKVVQTTVRAWEYIKDGHVDEGVDAIIANRPDSNLDPVILEGQIRGYLNYFDTPNTQGKPIGWQSEADWAEAISILRKAGLVKSELTPEDAFTNDFLAK